MDEVCFKTSGSTGRAKCVVRTEASLGADAVGLVGEFPEFWRDRPAVVASVPADHMYGALWRVRAPQAAGCAVESDTVLSAEGLLAALGRYGRFLFVTTPSVLEKLLVHPDVASLKGAFVGIVTSGSLLRKETALHAAEVLGTCPTEIFGSTETGTVAFRRRTEGDAWTLVGAVGARAADDGRLTVEAPYAVERPYVMSDAVSFVAPRRFLLRGRTDRQVKILEDFVSLPEVEGVLEGHPLVSRARVEALDEGVPRLGALVVLTEAGKARLAASTHRQLAAELGRDLLPSLGSSAFPRRIRFVRILPADERGKTTVADVRAALGGWCREPVVSDWRQEAADLSATLAFPPDMECFDGHFPGLPILPGVAQLYFLRHFARQAFPDFPDAATYLRLKFQKVILPGQAVRLTVSRRAEGSFEFALVGAHGPCASGRIERSPS